MALERSQPELHAAMKRCFAVVNSSVSEGMSATILEVNIFRPHGCHVNSFNTIAFCIAVALWCKIMLFYFHQSNCGNIYCRPYWAVSVSATALSVCSRGNWPNELPDRNLPISLREEPKDPLNSFKCSRVRQSTPGLNSV